MCPGCRDKVPRTGALKQQKFISYSSGGQKSESLLLGSWTAAFSVSSHGLPSVYVCVLISSSYEDTCHNGLGPPIHPNDLILTSYLVNEPISKYSHVPSFWGLGLAPMNLGRITAQPITPCSLRSGLDPLFILRSCVEGSLRSTQSTKCFSFQAFGGCYFCGMGLHDQGLSSP